ncbi:MAG: nucleoside recognition protein [Firmicutes bacterium]|nr:nucleoside recognition protein [Bacillota bacterium]
MELLEIFFEKGIVGSIKSVWGIAIIVIPLMLFMEIAKDLKVLDYIGKLFKPVTKLFNAHEKSGFPLAVGIIFGISYGAGVLIKSTEDGDIDSKSLLIISVFLAACHAIVEDTLLFVAVGATGMTIILMRVLVAFIVTMIISRFIKSN